METNKPNKFVMHLNVVLLYNIIEFTYPNINFRSHVAFTLKNFGCSVWWRSTPRCQQLIRRIEIRKTKIGNFDLHIGIEQQIFGLQCKRKNNL